MTAPQERERIVAEELIVALTALAERGIPSDIVDLLISGDPVRGIRPGALAYALKAALSHPSDTAGNES